MNLKDAWIYAINEARKEAIEECAKKMIYCPDYTLNSKENDKQESEARQSILSLIKELK